MVDGRSDPPPEQRAASSSCYVLFCAWRLDVSQERPTKPCKSSFCLAIKEGQNPSHRWFGLFQPCSPGTDATGIALFDAAIRQCAGALLPEIRVLYLTWTLFRAT